MVEIFKNKKKAAITGGILAAVVAIGTISINANAAMTVNAYKADRGALSQIIEINGNVETDTSLTYYAEIDGKIGVVHVKEGDFVKKGDLLISYNEEKLDYLASLEEPIIPLRRFSSTAVITALSTAFTNPVRFFSLCFSVSLTVSLTAALSGTESIYTIW